MRPLALSADYFSEDFEHTDLVFLFDGYAITITEAKAVKS